MREHAVDRGRVFIAGLSAGGAVAAIVAHAHPDIDSAAGVHSGLARGTAGDAMAAMTAMKSGAGPALDATDAHGAAPAGSRAVPTPPTTAITAATCWPPAVPSRRCDKARRRWAGATRGRCTPTLAAS